MTGFHHIAPDSIERAWMRFEEVKAGFLHSDTVECFHCGEPLDVPRDECPCLPVEPPCEPFDEWWDR